MNLDEHEAGEDVVLLNPRQTTEAVTQLLQKVQEIRQSLQDNANFMQRHLLTQSQYVYTPQGQYFPYIPQGQPSTYNGTASNLVSMPIQQTNVSTMQNIHEETSVVGETVPEIVDSGKQSSTQSQSKKRKSSSTIASSPKRQKDSTDDGVLSLGEDYSEISDIDVHISGLTAQMNNRVDVSSKDASKDEDDLDNILNSLHSEINEDEEKGSPIKESLAKCVSEIWKKPLSKEKYMDRLKKYKVPNNVELNTQRCNPEVWTHMLSAKQKSNDIKLQINSECTCKNYSFCYWFSE